MTPTSALLSSYLWTRCAKDGIERTGDSGRAGFSKTEMVEVLIQTRGYAGYPAALYAISIAAEVGSRADGGPVDAVAVVRMTV